MQLSLLRRSSAARAAAVAVSLSATAIAVATQSSAAGASAGPASAGVPAIPSPLVRARPSARAAYVPGVVVVGYRGSPSASARARIARAADAPVEGPGPPSAAAPSSSALSRGAPSPGGLSAPAGSSVNAGLSATGGTPAGEQLSLVHLPRQESVPAAIARLRHTLGVRWAVPDYLAHAAGVDAPAPTPASPFVPDNEGNTHTTGGWQALQWNFAGPFGVEAPQAWGNLIADHADGGQGVVVAVLDTGIAFRNWKRFRRSPGFQPSQFVAGRDLVTPGTPPVDRNGHGTFVAGEIAERTNIPYGLTGLAYGVKLMPVRVLDASGEGDALTIARGIRFAVNHHAQIINLSLEFPAAIGAADVPELISALRYAKAHRVLVAAAAGNDGTRLIPFPARASGVVGVGASTEHGCLADYSNYGHHIALVAPGGGPDADLPGDPNCHPELAPGRDIFQVTFLDSSVRRFGMPSGYEGTSMAAPEVSATAALVIASGVLGRHPSPAAIAKRLEATARPLGDSADRSLYGAGLLDAAAATAPGGPGALTSAHVQAALRRRQG
jgi:serine protease